MGVDCDLCVLDAVLSDELWRLSLTTLKWTKIEVAPGGARPSARAYHTMTSVGLDLWVHGGQTGTSGEGEVCTTRAALLLLHCRFSEEGSEPLLSFRQQTLLVLGSCSACVWCGVCLS